MKTCNKPILEEEVTSDNEQPKTRIFPKNGKIFSILLIMLCFVAVFLFSQCGRDEGQVTDIGGWPTTTDNRDAGYEVNDTPQNGSSQSLRDEYVNSEAKCLSLIRSYPSVKSRPKVPEKGEVVISESLSAAMEEYHDENVIYFVKVIVFGENSTSSGNSGKMFLNNQLERLSRWINDNKYSDVVGVEDFGNIGDEESREYTLFAHCSTSFVKNFPADADYGYVLSLMDE